MINLLCGAVGSLVSFHSGFILGIIVSIAINNLLTTFIGRPLYKLLVDIIVVAAMKVYYIKQGVGDDYRAREFLNMRIEDLKNYRLQQEPVKNMYRTERLTNHELNFRIMFYKAGILLKGLTDA